MITKHLPVQLEGPAKVSLFIYDNNTFVVESFRDEEVQAGVALGLGVNQIQDVGSGEKIATRVRRKAPVGRNPKCRLR